MSTQNKPTRPERPWYKEPWPWILMGLPFTAVVCSVLLLFDAMGSDDGLVAEDYYEQGLVINQVLDRDKKAAELGIEAQAKLLPQGIVSVSFNAKEPEKMPQKLVLTFIHPTRKKEDQVVDLQRAGNQYVGRAPSITGDPLKGRWNLLLEDKDKTWRLESKVIFSDKNELASFVPLT